MAGPVCSVARAPAWLLCLLRPLSMVRPGSIDRGNRAYLIVRLSGTRVLSERGQSFIARSTIAVERPPGQSRQSWPVAPFQQPPPVPAAR